MIEWLNDLILQNRKGVAKRRDYYPYNCRYPLYTWYKK